MKKTNNFSNVKICSYLTDKLEDNKFNDETASPPDLSNNVAIINLSNSEKIANLIIIKNENKDHDFELTNRCNDTGNEFIRKIKDNIKNTKSSVIIPIFPIFPKLQKNIVKIIPKKKSESIQIMSVKIVKNDQNDLNNQRSRKLSTSLFNK